MSAELQPTTRWQGYSLVALAATIPLGEGLAFAALMVLGVLTLWSHAQRDVNEPSVLHVAGIALGVWITCGVLAYATSGLGILKAGEFSRWLPVATLFVVAWSIEDLPELWAKRSAQAFVIMLAVASLFGLVNYLLNVRPAEFLVHTEATFATQNRVPGQFHRSVVGGFYFHRLKMAHVLVVGFGGLLSRQLFLTLPLRRRFAEMALAGLFLSALFFTFARGALAALAFAGFCLVVLKKGVVRMMAGVGLFAALGVGALIPAIRARVMSMGAADTSETRALIWSTMARILADHPFGVGLGNYPKIVDRYYDLYAPAFNVRTYPHNIFLSAWAETGPFGVVAFAAFFVALAAYYFKRLQSYGSWPAATGLYCVLSVFFLGLTHDVFFHNAVALAFFGVMGWVLGVEMRHTPDSQHA